MRIAVLSRSAGFHAQNNITPILNQVPGITADYIRWHQLARAKDYDLIYLLGWYVGSFEAKLKHMELVKTGIPVVVHWSGSDTLLCREPDIADDEMFDILKRDNVIHVAQKQELVDEIAEFGITDVAVRPIASRLDIKPYEFDKRFDGTIIPKVSLYIPPNRLGFFHFEEVRKVAEKCSDIIFIIASFSSTVGAKRLTDNMVSWGKLGDNGVKTMIQTCNLHLRLVDHDGFSLSVIENGLAGRRIITNWDYPHSHKVKIDVDEVVDKIYDLADISEPDFECAAHYKKYFSAEAYSRDIVDILREKGVYDGQC